MTFNGQRLKMARIYRNMHMADLADNIGVSKQAIFQFENNLTKPKPDVEFSIITTLKFPRTFFYQEDDDIYDYAFKYSTLSDAIIECYNVDGKNVYELRTDYVGVTSYGREYNGDIRIAIGFGVPG